MQIKEMTQEELHALSKRKPDLIAKIDPLWMVNFYSAEIIKKSQNDIVNSCPKWISETN